MLRGDIYEVEFGPGQGREPSGRLPAVVISNDTFNVAPFALVVIPGLPPSLHSSARFLAVSVPAVESGLPADTTFICYLIRGVDPPRVDPPLLGRLPAARMADIDRILRNILDLHPPPSPPPPPPPARRTGPRP